MEQPEHRSRLDVHGLLLFLLIFAALLFDALLLSKEPDEQRVRWLTIRRAVVFVLRRALMISGMVPDTPFALRIGEAPPSS